jgi:three-Cys-motif partner protein
MAKSKKDHQFGGDWTTRKLEILSGYLAAYGKALENQQFTVAYIDAFAGTGYRTPQVSAQSGSSFLFPDLAAAEPQSLLDGSARLALQVEPQFDRYVFIERDRDRCQALESLKNEFPELSSAIDVRPGDANQIIQEMCARNWRKRRAVLFLDPYGMQVDWQTIEAVARTKAIDMWLLFPLGIGVNRLLLKNPAEIPESWRQRLTLLLGTDEWEHALYKTERVNMLFGEEEMVVKASLDGIAAFFVNRLKTRFPGVAEHPAVLSNSKGSPLYLFCFAAANEKGAPIALRIADHLLKVGR